MGISNAVGCTAFHVKFVWVEFFDVHPSSQLSLLPFILPSNKGCQFFHALFIKAPLKHPWKQSPPSGEEKGCMEPKKGPTELRPSLSFSPVCSSLPFKVSLCVSLPADLLLLDPSAFMQQKGAELI